MRLHVNPPVRVSGSKTLKNTSPAIEREIRQIIPPERIQLILDNIGLPTGGINLAFSSSCHHLQLRRRHPDRAQAWAAGDPEVLHAPDPSGHGQEVPRRHVLLHPRQHHQSDPRLRPARSHRSPDRRPRQEQLRNRRKAGQADRRHSGRQSTSTSTSRSTIRPCRSTSIARAPASSVSPNRTSPRALSSRSRAPGQTAPNEWLNPLNGVNYQVVVQTPIYPRGQPAGARPNPRHLPNGSTAQLLGNLADFRRDESPIVIDHYNIHPVFDIYADVDQRDLGGVASADPQRSCKQTTPTLPTGTTLDLRGEVKTMQDSFTPPRHRHYLCPRPGLPAYGSQLPELARSPHHPHGDPLRLLRHPVDALPDPNHLQRPLADGRPS